MVDARNYDEARGTGLFNTAAIVGSLVTFECYYHNTTGDNTAWYRYAKVNTTVNQVRVSAGSRVAPGLRNRFKVQIDERNKRVSLSIDDVQLNDSGMYARINTINGHYTYNTMDLIVMGKNLLSNIVYKTLKSSAEEHYFDRHECVASPSRTIVQSTLLRIASVPMLKACPCQQLSLLFPSAH